MKTIKYTLATLMVALVVAVVLVGCKKDKEAQNLTNNDNVAEEVVRKPIATYNQVTGRMTYLVSVEQLQKGLSECSATKDMDGYIVESWDILYEEDETMPLTLHFSILNTETEKSESIFLIQSFLTIEKVGSEYVFYLSSEVESGNYEFLAQSEQGIMNQLVKIRNNTVFSIEEWDGVSKQLCGYYVKCIGTNCKSGCELEMTQTSYVCTPCIPDPRAGDNWSCTREEGTGQGYASMLGLLYSM